MNKRITDNWKRLDEMVSTYGQKTVLDALCRQMSASEMTEALDYLKDQEEMVTSFDEEESDEDE